MRTMMKVAVPVEAGNKTLQDGTLPRVLEETMGRLRPEAAYFYAENGVRTGFLIFDLQDPSDLPSISEPVYRALNAKIDFTPVMTAQDLQAGLKKLGR